MQMVQEVQGKRGAGCEVRCVRAADCKGYGVQGVTVAGCIEDRVTGCRVGRVHALRVAECQGYKP